MAEGDLQAFGPERPVPPGPPPDASWAYRLGAALVDVGLVLPAAGVAGAAVGLAGGDGFARGLAALLALMALWVLDAAVLPVATNGQTLGKRLAGIRVVHEDRTPYRYGTALARDVVGRALFIIPPIGLIDSLGALGARHQTLRDRIVGTRVVRAPAYRSRRWPLTGAAAGLSVLLGALILVGMAQRSYTGADRDRFISGCAAQGPWTTATCGCIFDRVAAALPYREFVQSGRQRGWTATAEPVVQGAVRVCAAD